ncbi:hypothetical protein N0V90_011201 [Kalmusia sp. IMI 367209]|nr:hypothetical protein N0V90_011201 [Kalmusia sp. IMI 367209]
MLTTHRYTTAFALFEALWEARITACFVNVGSDHPSIIEAILKGKRERPDKWPRFITCPAEITALSMADGYARISGKPQAVVVHVDVGTQALGQAVHNASIARVPVFIFAGLCPCTESGELTGSRTEYMHWLQQAPDQAAIVRQYCRFTGEVRTGLNVKQSVGRALQFANSAPRGPVYLASAREVLAQEIQPYSLQQDQWVPIGPSALPLDAVQEMCIALVQAERPLVITGYSGRDRRTPDLLVALADAIPGIRVHDTGGSDTTVIYHVDSDPLNQQIPVSFFPAHGRWKVDSFTALNQLLGHIKSSASLRKALEDPKFAARGKARAKAHQLRLANINAQRNLDDAAALDADNIGHLLKTALPESTTFVIEAVTAAQTLHDQIQPRRPESWINCGGTGIGWSNGAALGIKMALEDLEKAGIEEPRLVCQVVGDGSFMCASPSSALWVARKCEIPILTMVLNNGGWKAPRNSTELVYPEGLNISASDDEINISFRPTPNYAALAEAAAGCAIGSPSSEQNDWMQGVRVSNVGQLYAALNTAKEKVGGKKKGMLIEVIMY